MSVESMGRWGSRSSPGLACHVLLEQAFGPPCLSRRLADMTTHEETDLMVRVAVYDSAMSRSRPLTAAELSQALDLPLAEVRASLERLATGRVLVLQPESREVLMAPPFSAVPTPFTVLAAERTYFANCIWDALGISAMLGCDARVETSCGCCGEGMSLTVADQALQDPAGLVHFAIPARRWWEDIVFS
jgi:Alkylmercury lyase